MKLFWKIYAAVFISFVIVISFLSYAMTVRQVSEAENHIVEENRIIGSFITKEIEESYQESRLPFGSLKKLSERKGFYFWWVIRDDATIHLADNVSFMETYAYEYFPQIANIRDENVFLNGNQNYGILIKPLEMAEKKWSFWLGFSLEEVLQIRKQIIFRTTVVSILALGMLGLILYFTVMHFTKPIKDLTVSTAIIGKGDLSHRAKIEPRDEVGELANSFNKMAEELQRTTVSKDHVNDIIDSMIDTLIVVDRDTKIEMMNKATCKLLGYEEEELIGRPFETVFAAGEEISAAGTKLERPVEKGEVSNYETYYKTKDGEKIPVLLSCSVTNNGDGDMIYMVCTARDITQRKRAEEELKQYREHLEKLVKERTVRLEGTLGNLRKEVSERKRAENLIKEQNERLKELDRMKSEFLSTAAHELRTPLTSILGFSEILLERKLDKKRQVKFLKIVNKESEGLANIVNDLLDVSSIESGRGFEIKKAPVEFKDIILENVDLFQAQIDKHTFKVNLPDDLVKIEADKDKINQVMENIISNAVKFSPEGGEITVSLEETKGKVKVSVADTGMGIPEKDLPHIFEKFYRAENTSQFSKRRDGESESWRVE